MKLTYTDLLTAIVARVLKQHPRMNASWIDDTIKANPEVKIGLAMAVSDGVVVGGRSTRPTAATSPTSPFSGAI